MNRAKLLFTLLLMLGVSTVIGATSSQETTSELSSKGGVIEFTKDDSLVFQKKGSSFSLLCVGAQCPESSFAEKGFVADSSAHVYDFSKMENQVVVELTNGRLRIKSGKLENLVKLQNSVKTRKSIVKYNKTDSVMQFSFTQKPLFIRYFSLSNPDRLVFDFIGIHGKIKDSSIRYANHPAGLRVVVDGRQPENFSFVRKGNEIALLKNDSSKIAAFTTTRKDSEATVAAEKNPVKKSVVSEKVEVKGIAFVGENPEILTISADKPVEVTQKKGDKQLEITCLNAFISKDKEQFIDASSLNGPVKELAIFNEGNNVKILVRYNSGNVVVEQEASSSGSRFVFARKLEIKDEAVAGYSEEQMVNLPQAAMTGQVSSNMDPMVKTMETQKRSYRGKRISLDFKDVDILDILRLMSEISKLNIIAGDDVKGTVTVRLINIPWDEALDVILRSKSLGKERFGNIIRVATIRTLQQEKETELAKQKAQQKLEPIKVRLVAVNYAMAKELMPQIKELLTERGTVSTDTRTNVLIIKDVEEVLDKAEQLVQYLDTQTPQVNIEAKIIEATSHASQGLGIQWNANHYRDAGHGNATGLIFPYNMGMGGAVNVPGPAAPTGALGFSFGSIGNITDLNLTLNVMESEGRIKIVSSPKVSTLDNIEAMIQQGVSLPITTRGQNGEVTTKYIDATLILKTTPHITSDGSILMNININKSEPDWGHTNALGEPAILKKEATTDILIKSGDTIVIGGVYTNLSSKTIHGVPILSDIPILGWLFKSEEEEVSRSELLIFITPKIMNQVKSSIPLAHAEE